MCCVAWTLRPNDLDRLTHTGLGHADQRLVDQELRTFDLMAEPVLDDRAVEELANAVGYAAVLGGEALGALTRRESELTFGDLLQPLGAEDARTRNGVRFTVTLTDDSDSVLAVMFATESAATGLADLFFGGPGEGAERRLTQIEARSVTASLGGVIAPVVAVLTGREGCKVQLKLVKQADLPAADLVELSFQVTVGDTTIDAALFVENPDGSIAGTEFRDAIAKTVQDMPVAVNIDLAHVQMAAAEVQALSDGDVVVFDATPDDDAIVRAGSRELLRGRLGERSGRRFLEVTEVLVSH
jgi:hypothetical protein